MFFKILLLVFLCDLLLLSAQDTDEVFVSAVLKPRLKANWFKYNQKTYYLVTDYMGNFYTAMQYCRQLGMQLLSISNKEESDRIQQYHTDHNFTVGKYWTSGLSYVGEWIWLSTGNVVSYFNWARNEPNSDGSESCLELYTNNDFKWNDANCNNIRHFICECVRGCQ